MKCIGLLACSIFFCNFAMAQVGTWQLTIKRIDGVKETGFAYITCNQDGTSTGYALTTLTFGVAEYSGTWTTDGQGHLFSTFTESLNGQLFSGALQAKFTSTSIKGTVVGNGVTYKIKGTPAMPVPDFSGNWFGTVKQSGITVAENFTAVQNSEFPGIFDFSGTIFSPTGPLSAFGQVAVNPKGKGAGYSVTDLGSSQVAAYFTGKYNPTAGTLNVKGIDEHGVKLVGRFHR